MTAECDVSILVVGYNSREFLSDCLSAVPRACQRHSHEILFINNGTDQTEALVEQQFPHVRIVATCGNVGFAQGNNILAARATGRLLLLLNPDTQLETEAIDLMAEAITGSFGYACVGAVAVNSAGVVEEKARASQPSLGSLIGSIFRVGLAPAIDSNATDPVEVDAVNGGCMMVERAIWNQLGGMDEDYFLYTEDVDFSRRLQLHGKRMAVVPRSRVLHEFGSGDAHSSNRRRFMLLGNATYYHKHFSPAYAWACVTTLWAACLTRYLAGTILGVGSSRFRKMADAYRFGALHPLVWGRGYFSRKSDPRLAMQVPSNS